MEIWLPITDFESYEISNYGRIRNIKTNKPQKSFLNDKGYLKVAIINNDGIKRKFRVHRLVGLMFIPNPENKPQINHKNGIKTDNHVDNLEWATGEENIEHALRSDFIKSKKRKLTKEDVFSILENKNNLTKRELANQFNVSICTIRNIQRGKIYKSITKDYYGVINIYRPIYQPKPKHTTNPLRKLSYEEYVFIIDNKNVISQNKLAKQFNVSKRTIYSIRNNHLYKDYYLKYTEEKNTPLN